MHIPHLPSFPLSHKSFSLITTILVLTYSAFGQGNPRSRDNSPEEPEQKAEEIFIEGERYFILEDYGKALEQFERGLDLSPNAAFHYKVAEILSKSEKDQDLQAAVAHMESALELEDENKYYYILSSNLYTQLGIYNKAERALEQMIEKIPGTGEYLYELAAIYQYDGKINDALKTYERAEEMLGIREVSSLQKQKIYFDQGKTDEAIQEGIKLMNAFPDEERYVVGLAETLSQYDQPERGIPYLEKYISDHSDASSSKVLLAGLYQDTGQSNKAEDLIFSIFNDPAVELSSKVIMLSTYVAQIGNESNPKLETLAQELFSHLQSGYPNDPNVNLIGGDLYLTLGNSSKAKTEYSKAINNGSSSYDAWRNLLTLESDLNQIDSLLIHSEDGLELFPNQPMVYYFNGYAKLRKGNYREATFSLEQARRLSARNPELVHQINVLLGDAYHGAKNFPKSNQAYEDALAFDPNDNYVLNNYSYYLAERKQNLDKAEEMAARLIQNVPDNADYLDTYAWVLYQQEKYVDAQKVMEKALATNKAGAVHFDHYGDILFRIGQIENAVEQWKKSKLLDPSNSLLDDKITNRKIQ